MSVTCPACGERPAPNENGKCSECATAAVAAWKAGQGADMSQRKGESAAERRARLARMGDADYRRVREGGE